MNIYLYNTMSNVCVCVTRNCICHVYHRQVIYGTIYGTAQGTAEPTGHSPCVAWSYRALWPQGFNLLHAPGGRTQPCKQPMTLAWIISPRK